MPIWSFTADLTARLITGKSVGQRQADNKTGTGRCLNPHITAVLENSSAGER
jgi:hypothetical protein